MHRLSNIQALRAVAVLLVVLRHLQVYAARIDGGHQMPDRFVAGDMGVDLFFVISGAILVTVHQQPLSTGLSGAADFLYRRAARIYPLYWLYSLPVLAVHFWQPGWLHRSSLGMEVHPLRSLLLWPQRNWPLLGQAWSLIYEMYFYVVLAGLMLLPGSWFRAGLLVWAGIVLVGDALLARLPVLECPETRLVCALLTLEFIAGALVGLALRETLPDRRHTVAGWLAFGLGVAWIAGMLPLDIHLTGSRRLVGYGVPCVLLVYGLMTLEKAGWRSPRFLTMIGDWSYSVYLSHIGVIAVLAHLLSWWPALPRLVQEILLEIGGVIAVLLTGALSYRYLETPLLQMSRRRPSARLGSHVPVPSADPS